MSAFQMVEQKPFRQLLETVALEDMRLEARAGREYVAGKDIVTGEWVTATLSTRRGYGELPPAEAGGFRDKLGRNRLA